MVLEKTYQTNVKGPNYLAKKAKENNVRCFINFSSNKSINPKSIYGKQKKEFESDPELSSYYKSINKKKSQ